MTLLKNCNTDDVDGYCAIHIDNYDDIDIDDHNDDDYNDYGYAGHNKNDELNTHCNCEE
jgi:hypothetical protein